MCLFLSKLFTIVGLVDTLIEMCVRQARQSTQSTKHKAHHLQSLPDETEEEEESVHWY